MTTDMFEELHKEIGIVKLQFIEMLAKEYLEETFLNPSEVELAMRIQGNTIRWYFRKLADVEVAVSLQSDKDDE